MLTANALLEVGTRGLKTFQIAMGVTSHNITNSNTEGYTRQRAELSSSYPIFLQPHIFGTGVQVDAIVRLRESVLDATIRGETSEVGRWEVNAQTLGTLETMLGNATNGSLGEALNAFWNGWQDLTSGPEEMGARQSLLDLSQRIADVFHGGVRRLDDLNTGLNTTVTAAVAKANGYTQSIAELNREIARAELNGANANDLRDRRDLLVEKLSRLTDVHVVEQPNGMLDIDVNGDVLVSGVNSFALSAVLNGGTNHMEVQLGGNPLAFTSGAFQGFTESFGEVDGKRAQLDQLAATLISEVNSRHAAGFDLQGNPAGAFFAGTDAATIGLDPALASNPAQIAASTTAAPGGNDLALAIAQLRDLKVIPGGTPTMTLNEAFNSLVLDLGSGSKRATETLGDFERIRASVAERRSAVSGVNMDEELSNLLTFQRAYEASARLITTVDEMMDMIINRMGIVGR